MPHRDRCPGLDRLRRAVGVRSTSLAHTGSEDSRGSNSSDFSGGFRQTYCGSTVNVILLTSRQDSSKPGMGLQ